MEATTRRGLDPVRQPLDNDAVVLVKETRTTPAVTISVAVSAGGIYEREDRLGLANFLSRVIDRGTAHRAAEEIAEGLDARGVTLSTAATRHSVLLSCTCLSEDFDFILRLLGEVVTEPVVVPVGGPRIAGQRAGDDAVVTRRGCGRGGAGGEDCQRNSGDEPGCSKYAIRTHRTHPLDTRALGTVGLRRRAVHPCPNSSQPPRLMVGCEHPPITLLNDELRSVCPWSGSR